VKALLPDPTLLGRKAAAGLEAGSAKQNEFLGAIVHADLAEARKQWMALLKPFAVIDGPVARLEGAVERHRRELAQLLKEAEDLHADSPNPTTTYLDLRIRFERLLESQARIANDRADLSARLSAHPEAREALAAILVVARVLSEPSLAAQRKTVEEFAKEAGISLPSDAVLERNLAALRADTEAVGHWAAALHLAAEEQMIHEINRLVAQAAFRMNTLPSQLPQDVGEYRLGRWFDNKTVTVTISAGPRFAAYSAGAAIQAPPKAGKASRGEQGTSAAWGPIPSDGNKAAPDSPVSDDESGTEATSKFIVDPQVKPDAPVETKTVATAVFEVHQLYHFRIAPGFVYSSLNDVQYDTSSREVADGVDEDGKPKTKEETYLIQTRDRDHQMFPTINLIWYPVPRDLFPGRWKPAVGVLAGLSLVDPRRDFVVGLSLELTPAVSLHVGRHYGYQPDPPAGIAPGDALPANVPTFVENRLAHGTFFGLTFDLTIFKQLFGALGF
jgi:hypothetical protein